MAVKSNKEFVIDASFALAYLLPDERINIVDRMFNQYVKEKIIFISNHLFFFEVLNGLKSAVIKKRINKKDAFILAKAFLSLNIRTEKVDFDRTFRKSLEKNLSVYDASYLTLSIDKKIPILSMDRKLIDLSN